MKPISELVSRTLATTPPAANDERKLPTPPGGYHPPELPPDLREQVDIIAEPHRFDDFVLVRKATFHPDAARYAEEMRRALQPAPPKVIFEWFLELAADIGAPHADQKVMRDAVHRLANNCGDLPPACWTKATRKMVARKQKWWPKPADIDELLNPIAEEMRRDLRALNKIAEAPRPAPSRASTTPYDPGPAPDWATNRKLPPEDPAELAEAGLKPLSRAQEPVRTVAEQIAALGGVGDVDLLAARRNRVAPPRRPAP